MFNKILSSFIIIICFMGCTRKADDLVIAEKRAVAIDESKQVLMRLPAGLCMINDSVVAAAHSRQKLSTYNVYTGRNLQNFSLDHFNFDSLISATYRKKYDGIKTFGYDRGYELNGENYQLVNYYYTGKTYYILVSLLAEVNNLKDSSEVAKLRNSEEAKKLGDVAKTAKITVMDYVNFMFTLDDKFRMKEVIPMYAEEQIRKDNYFAYFHKNFAVEGGYIYVPVARSGDNINLEAAMDNDKNNFAFAKINIHNQDDMQLIMDYNDLDFSDYRMQDYFDASCTYIMDGGELLASTGKEIMNMSTKKKLLARDHLGKDEWVQNFFKKDDQLFLATYTNEHKKSVVISGHTCPVDSVTDCHLKIYDLGQDRIVADKKLPEPFVGGAMTGDKIVYATRNSKNYFLDNIGYHEK